MASVVVLVDDSYGGGCPECHWYPRTTDSDEQFQVMANHLIDTHGMVLVHAGQRTTRVDDGLFQSTVMVFAKPRVLSRVPMPELDDAAVDGA